MGIEEGDARLFPWVSSKSIRDNKHIKFCLNIRNYFFFLCVGDRALVQVVQRGGGHSNPGETQNQTGHGPEQEVTADVF